MYHQFDPGFYGRTSQAAKNPWVREDCQAGGPGSAPGRPWERRAPAGPSGSGACWVWLLRGRLEIAGVGCDVARPGVIGLAGGAA